MTDIDAVCEETMNEKCEEIEALHQQLERYGKRSLGWMMTELDRLTAELAAARPIVEAAKAWRDLYGRFPRTPAYAVANALIAAIDAARGAK